MYRYRYKYFFHQLHGNNKRLDIKILDFFSLLSPIRIRPRKLCACTVIWMCSPLWLRTDGTASHLYWPNAMANCMVAVQPMTKGQYSAGSMRSKASRSWASICPWTSNSYSKAWKRVAAKAWTSCCLHAKIHFWPMLIMYAFRIIIGWEKKSHASHMACEAFAISSLRSNALTRICIAASLVALCKL